VCSILHCLCIVIALLSLFLTPLFECLALCIAPLFFLFRAEVRTPNTNARGGLERRMLTRPGINSATTKLLRPALVPTCALHSWCVRSGSVWSRCSLLPRSQSWVRRTNPIHDHPFHYLPCRIIMISSLLLAGWLVCCMCACAAGLVVFLIPYLLVMCCVCHSLRSI